MKNSIWTKIILFFIGISIIFGGYIIISVIYDNELIVPSILNIFVEIGNIFIKPNLLWLLIITLLKVILIILISIILSIIIGFLYYNYKGIKYLLKPIVSLSKSAPFLIVALYLYILFFNNRSIVPYIIVFMVLFPIIYEATIGAIDNIEAIYIDDLSLLDITKLSKYVKAIIPFILPSIIISLFQSFGLGFKVVVMSEYLCSVRDSVGEIISDGILAVDYTKILAWLIVITFTSILMDFIIKLVNEKILNKN